MKRISKYQADDGKEFQSEAECHNYELSKTFIKEARDEYDPGKCNRVDSFLILVLDNPKPFRDKLNNYIRRMKKPVSDETLLEAA